MNLDYLALMYKDNPVLTRRDHQATCTYFELDTQTMVLRSRHYALPTVQSTLDYKIGFPLHFAMWQSYIDGHPIKYHLEFLLSASKDMSSLTRKHPRDMLLLYLGISSVSLAVHLHEVDQQRSCDEHHVFVFKMPLVPCLTLRLGSILLSQKVHKDVHHGKEFRS